jgi:peroxidase
MKFGTFLSQLLRAHDKSLARTHRTPRKPNVRQSKIEPLETRQLFASDIRSFDGTGNNLIKPEWGSTNEAFLRIAAAEYADGKSAPAGADRASARAISNLVSAQTTDATDERGLSAFIYAWGQFLDHDLDLTPTGTAGESFPITIPKGDSSFDPQGTGTKTMALTRSLFDPSTGATNARQQINEITAFVDGSMVYGSSLKAANALRSFVGGRLQTSAGNLLPIKDGAYVAGDVRVIENPELTSMHTLFMREHNRQADKLAARNPTWSDEKIYQEARRIVIGEIQAITYNEFLPALIGSQAIRPYRGYNPEVNPGIANEFATAAYRLGHSMLGSDIEFLDNDGNELRDPVGLRDAFFNVSLVADNGIDGILKYLASDNANKTDTQIVDDIRNFLFGPPGSGGLDLASLNIQRGRDHGLADYNAVRKAYGLPQVRTFADITRNVELQNALKAAYGDVNNIDLWVGGLAEDHAPGAAVGPTFQRIIAEQFTRTRDGDRFWYERDLKGATLEQVRRTTLSSIIRENTTTKNLQNNIFFFRTSIEGRAFEDVNRNGRLDGREKALANVSVSLVDQDGKVVSTTRTNQQGVYRFENISLGVYRVVKGTTSSAASTTPSTREVAVTRGMELKNVDLALTSPNAAPPIESPSRPTRLVRR